MRSLYIYIYIYGDVIAKAYARSAGRFPTIDESHIYHMRRRAHGMNRRPSSLLQLTVFISTVVERSLTLRLLLGRRYQEKRFVYSRRLHISFYYFSWSLARSTAKYLFFSLSTLAIIWPFRRIFLV